MSGQMVIHAMQALGAALELLGLGLYLVEGMPKLPPGVGMILTGAGLLLWATARDKEPKL